MKKLIMFMAIAVSTSQVFASDMLEDEIICNKVRQSGSADDGLTVTLQSNETAWVKNVQITENGYLGRRVIGNVQVPLQPRLVIVSEGFVPVVDMVYEGKEATLSVRAIETSRLLLGTGTIDLRLNGYEPETVDLTCQYAK